MDSLDILVNRIQPDFAWTVDGMEQLMKVRSFQSISQVLTRLNGNGCPVKAKLEVKEDGRVFLSLQFLAPYHADRLLPTVYYVIKDRSGQGQPTIRSSTYLFGSELTGPFEFEEFIFHQDWLQHPAYNVDDSLAVEVYVEAATVAQQVQSYDGNLVWAVDRYEKRKEAEWEQVVTHQESPYFYTGPRGYRVRVQMYLIGYEEHRGQGLSMSVCFLPGKFDADLPTSFPHAATLTLFNRKNPEDSVVHRVERDIREEREYVVDMCYEDDVRHLIEDDTLYYGISIEASRKLDFDEFVDR